MRVIGGKSKGRRLQGPGRPTGPGAPSIRPTPDRVREALFSILDDFVKGASFLDVFAGTGALSAEALSRGAGRATLLEDSQRALLLAVSNLSGCGFSRDLYRILPGDALTSLARLAEAKEAFDLIFLDPPYESDLGERALRIIGEGGLLRDGGRAILEHSSREKPVEGQRGLRQVDTREYGDTTLSFYELVERAPLNLEGGSEKIAKGEE